MLTADQRRERYARQGGPMTGARQRRIRHKERHAAPTGRGLTRRARIAAVAALQARHRAWRRSR